MDKRIAYGVALAIIAGAALYLFLPSDFSGGAGLESGRLEGSVVPKITYSTDNYGALNEKIEDVDRERDSINGDEKQYIETANIEITEKTYFDKAYQCVRLPADAMGQFGTAVGNERVDDKRKIAAGTRVTATLSWGDSISWSYPKLRSCQPGEMQNWGVYPIMRGTSLSGVNADLGEASLGYGDYVLNGWAQTNIKYVSDGSAIKTLAESGWFDVIGFMAKVPAVQAEKDACSESCPKVTKSCSKRSSSSTYEKCMNEKKKQEKARANCLSSCSNLEVCTYDVNGAVIRDACGKYDAAKLGVNETITLFKDGTARMYSPYEDFRFFADFRGGVSDAYLCRLKPAPTCNDGSCNGNETCSICEADCGACPISCGDGICNGEETCSDCQDCACSEGEACNSGICEVVLEPVYCTQETRSCPDSSPMQRAANCTWLQDRCPLVIINGTKTNATDISYCKDGVCDPDNETCSSCEADCGKCVACDNSQDCASPTEFGLEANPDLGQWQCVSNTCQWSETAGIGGGAGLDIDDSTWLAIGAIMVGGGALAFFLLKRRRIGKI